MDRGGFFRGLVLAILIVAVVGGVAVYAYNAGIAQGVAESGKLPAPTGPIAPFPYYGPFFFHPFGFGGFGCLFPLLFFLLFFALARGIFWRGHWGWKHHGYWENGVPPKFDEWHKRAHGSGSTENK